VFLFLDVISVTNTPTSLEDPFAALNRAYAKHISSRRAVFDTSQILQDETKRAFKLKITLMPHQILIFPTRLIRNFSDTLFQNLMDYEEGEIRYEKYLYIFYK